jgi:hypothetical protein
MLRAFGVIADALVAPTARLCSAVNDDGVIHRVAEDALARVTSINGAIHAEGVFMLAMRTDNN